MSLVLVVAPLAERYVAPLRARLGQRAAVVADPDPDPHTRQHAELLVLGGLSWAAARERVLTWRTGGFDRVVVLVLDDAPGRSELRALGPVVPTTPAFLVEAVASALQSGASAWLRLSCCEVDLVRRTARREGRVLSLSSQEARLLAWLAARPGQEVGREELLRGVWGHRGAVPTRAVDMAIYRLRRKIERNPNQPDHLQAVRGGGYRFITEPVPARPALPELPATAFFGRQAELADLDALWAAGRRLVALVGPPGVGKTRLAREHARARAPGALWCDLGQVTDLGALNTELACLLDIETSGSSASGAQQAIGEALDSRRVELLVLDDADRLARALAAPVSLWLASAPRLRVLLSAQGRPGMPGETVREVAPLPADEASALFLDRAAAAGADARRLQGPELDGLVSLLDGLPLALELAAPRARGLSLPDLRQRLSGRLDLLTDGAGRGEPRRATMRGAVGWAWDLLHPAARDALAQLSVFPGSFSLDDAEMVLRSEGEPAAGLLSELVDRSLVQYHAGDARYSLLWSVRTFAAEQDGPLVAGARARHARDMARQARRWVDELRGEGALETIEGMKGQQARLRAALEELREGPPQALIEVVSALDALWAVVGTPDQRLSLLDGVLEALRGDTSALARATALRGLVHGMRGAATLAERDLREAVALHQAAGDVESAGRVLFQLVGSLRRRGLIDEATSEIAALARIAGASPVLRALAEIEGSFVTCLRGPERAVGAAARRRLGRAVRVCVAAGELTLAAHGWLLLVTAHELAGDIEQAVAASERFEAVARTRAGPESRRSWAYQRVVLDLLRGRYADAVQGAERLRTEARASGHHALVRNIDSALAAGLHGLGRDAEAHAAWERCVAASRASAAPRIALSAQVGLATALLEEGRTDEARELIDESLREAAALGLGRIEASYLLLQGALLVHEGQPQEAGARLDAIDRGALRPEQVAGWALLRVAVARRTGAGDGGAREIFSELVAGSAFAGQEGYVSALAAIERGDSGTMALHSLPPAPPLLRVIGLLVGDSVESGI